MKRHHLLLCAIIASAANFQVYATQAIANWDMVPFEIFDSTINVGVVAFHETGVDVEFSANGNLIQRVADPSYNSAANTTAAILSEGIRRTGHI
jgi:hypothetical protein